MWMAKTIPRPNIGKEFENHFTLKTNYQKNIIKIKTPRAWAIVPLPRRFHLLPPLSLSFPSLSPPAKAVLPSISFRRSGYIPSPPHPASGWLVLRRGGSPRYGGDPARRLYRGDPARRLCGVQAAHTTDSGSIDSPMMQSMEKKIKELLNAGIVIVQDAYGDGRNVSIGVISKAFEGQSMANRPRKVYKTIWEELQSTVHAVDQITTRTPAEAAGES